MQNADRERDFVSRDLAEKRDPLMPFVPEFIIIITEPFPRSRFSTRSRETKCLGRHSVWKKNLFGFDLNILSSLEKKREGLEDLDTAR